jgi:predicted metalloendopeptidase
MMQLRRDDGFGGRGDEFYESLINAHHGLSDTASGALNARLVLLLANHIGDLGVIRQALEAARESVAVEPGGGTQGV